MSLKQDSGCSFLYKLKLLYTEDNLLYSAIFVRCNSWKTLITFTIRTREEKAAFISQSSEGRTTEAAQPKRSPRNGAAL